MNDVSTWPFIHSSNTGISYPMTHTLTIAAIKLESNNGDKEENIYQSKMNHY